MKPRIDLSIIYVYFNTPNELLDSLSSIPKSAKNVTYEIIIVNNMSPKPLPKLGRLKNIQILINNTNRGFGAAANQAARVAKGKYLLIINPDTVFGIDSIKKMIDAMQKNSKIGILAPKLLDAKGNILQNASRMPLLPKALILFSSLGTVWPLSGVVSRHHLQNRGSICEQVVEVVGGACMMIRKTCFSKVRGFDERFFMYFEESDLCFRIKALGYLIVYFPEAVVVHFVGKSSDDKDWIKHTFEESRQKFFRKYHGPIVAYIAGASIDLMQKSTLLVLFIFFLSLFLNLFTINQSIMFFGDIGRDFLAARDILIYGKVPLVGITSSVVWLHQGPLAIYLIAFSFLVLGFAPSSPAILFGLLGTLTTLFVYKLGKGMFSKRVGLLAAIFFATSPLVVINVRSPYHTAPIPFFMAIFMYFCYKVLSSKKEYIFLLGITTGLLFQLELSNAVIFLVLALLFIFYRKDFIRRDYFRLIVGFIIGIAPVILYDLTHSFIQTGGFVLWVLNRVRLFFGLTVKGHSTTHLSSSALVIIWNQIRRFVFPAHVEVVVATSISILTYLALSIKNFKMNNKYFLLVVLSSFVPLFGFLIHAAPGPAYFPILFVPLSLLIGLTFDWLANKWRLLIVIVLVFAAYNANYIISNQYFLDTTQKKGSVALGWDYGYGASMGQQVKQINSLITISDGKAFTLKAGGSWSKNPTSIDNYRYLLWWKNANISIKAKEVYTMFPSGDKNLPQENSVYKDEFITLYENE